MFKHFSSSGLDPQIASTYSYNIAIESLVEREKLAFTVNNPNPYTNFFQKYGDLGASFFQDTKLREILTEFGNPQKQIQPGQTSKLSGNKKLERDI
ncbi:MAG: hypothetical protein FJ368_05125 [Pelagibacterales bacterium]|nr:hypothetical protein [Pelagibacterales bacterium]